MDKKIHEVLLKLSERELLTDLNHPKFADMRSKYPKEWADLTLLYSSELDRMRSLFLGEFSTVLNRIEELKDEITTLKEANKELEIKLATKKSSNGLRLTILSIFVFVGGVVVLLFILNIIDKDAYKNTINDSKEIMLLLKDIVKGIIKIN